MKPTALGVSHIALFFFYFSFFAVAVVSLRVCSGAKKGPSLRSRSLTRGGFERSIRVGAFTQDGDSFDEAPTQTPLPFQTTSVQSLGGQ